MFVPAVKRILVHAASALLGIILAHAGSTAALLDKPDDWFCSHDGRRVTQAILSWQSPQGSWPKNQDNALASFTGDPKTIRGTFDNGATTDELRYLARAFRATGDRTCRDAFIKGFKHILAAQYSNGGWPQFHPPGRQYHRHVTFNDGSMIRLLEFLRDSERYDFIEPALRRQARGAFQRGIDCILKCQIVREGQATVWCAQHDARSLAPVTARSYELPSLSGSESAGILRFLMSLNSPSADVVRAIEAGAAWFEAAKLEGIRVVPADGDRKVIADPDAPPLWARFYDLESGRPFFCDRDGVKKDALADIGKERRNGYAWLGRWGDLVALDYARWRARRDLIKSGSDRPKH